MMKTAQLRVFLLWMGCLGLAAAEAAPLPKPGTGRIERLQDFASLHVPARNVDVWLPPGYSDKIKYAVLYMHDGQSLFDAAITWNKQEWRADEVAAELMAEGKVRPFIIVGVHNAGKRRHSEYFPQKPFQALPELFRTQLLAMNRNPQQVLFDGEVESDAYLKFLVKELKPYIDAQYSVDTGASQTAVMGSSMGGLISLYAIAEYPQIFGGAACLSTHWPGIFTVEDNPIPDTFIDYMQSNLPDPASHRLYFDYGTATLDALYPPLQAKADGVMRDKGYADGNWQTLKFEGAEHSEKAWAERLHLPMQFLFPVQ
jgi:hypothetical protein